MAQPEHQERLPNSYGKYFVHRRSTGSRVYSTEVGPIGSGCRRAVRECVCHAKATAKTALVGDGAARVSHQTKGRGGKSVTLVKGLALDPASLALLGKQLRAACGSGGTAKDGVIEIQRDHRELVLEVLGQRPSPEAG